MSTSIVDAVLLLVVLDEDSCPGCGSQLSLAAGLEFGTLLERLLKSPAAAADARRMPVFESVRCWLRSDCGCGRQGQEGSFRWPQG